MNEAIINYIRKVYSLLIGEKMAEKKQAEFLQWFNPTLDALREIGIKFLLVFFTRLVYTVGGKSHL